MIIEFILNEELIRTDIEPGTALLDFIRRTKQLPGTKIGCREGDCGACAVLEGSLTRGGLKYKTIVSCLTPMVNVIGKHIVTVEGLNMDKLSPVQEAMIENSASQCGFCTPGFVISLTSYLLTEEEEALASISGNICRCTGYKSIERAAREIERLKQSFDKGFSLDQLIKKGYIPEYFTRVKARLKSIETHSQNLDSDAHFIAGGTDLMVQLPDELIAGETVALLEKLDRHISISNGVVYIGAGIRISDFFQHEIIRTSFPFVAKVKPLFASDPIRNMGTLAGNIVNASPIGDLTIVLLALDASLVISDQKGITREVKLCDFSLGYKKVDLVPGELIITIKLPVPGKANFFHFTKVSKRTFLDIATVNSAIKIEMENGHIKNANVSVGGMAATPLLLKECGALLCNETISTDLIIAMADKAQEEVSPISDIRGSAYYKRLLLRQQLVGHFIHLFPGELDEYQLLEILKEKSIANEEY